MRAIDRLRIWGPCRSWALISLAWFAFAGQPLEAQDILSSQLRQGFGKNKVRYKDFQWWILESEHLELHYEPEFHDLAQRAIVYLEDGYDQISEILRHDLSTRPPIVIYQSQYEFQQTNIYQGFLPPGVAGFAEPLRYRMVIPFDGDLDEFRNVLIHELGHIFQYDILYKGPIKRISNSLSAPPTWIMEGQAEYVTQEKNTIDEMVLRDAVLTDQLIPIEFMNLAWGSGNVFLAYKQSHSIMEYIAANYGPEKISRILRLWDSQNDTDKLLERLIDMDMKTLHERWSGHMRKTYWPLLQSRDYLSELGERVIEDDSNYSAHLSPKWSLSGDMLAVLSTDGIEQHVDIIRLRGGSLVERITQSMRTSNYDNLTFGDGTVDWAPDGRTIAFVAKKGPKDAILLWDLYHKKLIQEPLVFDDLEVIESLDWSPDSQRLAFIGTGYGQSDLYIVDANSGDLQQITGTPQREDHPAFSPDGTQLAFCAKTNNQFDIRAYDMATGQSRVLIDSPTDDLWPNWLPEGNKILFISTRERINDLFVHHLETGQEYRLTRTLSGIMNPALSPDGRQIVMSTYYNGRRELYLMDMPEWPQVQERAADLAARVGQPAPPVQQPQASQADSSDQAPQVLVAALQDQAAKTLPDATAPSPLLDQTTPADKGELLYQASDDLSHLAPDPAAPAEASHLAQVGGEASVDLAMDDQPLRRRRYTPKLEFDGISLQMGYFNGFFSSIAQLSMSDLLGNHSLALATDYVASQEVDNDFNFAITYDYYGKRPKYNVAMFNWNQFYNNDRTYLVRGRFNRGITRSQQRGVLMDMSYPVDIYRRVDLSYTYVSETESQIWPEEVPLKTTSTHLFKAAYVHDSITYGLLGPTAGKQYFLSAGRTLALTNSNRSFSHLELDYRQYIRLGQWSVLGIRGSGVASLGSEDDVLRYFLGGPVWYLPLYTGFQLNMGPLRGYKFSSLQGTRVALLNTEIRVPFIRQVVFGWPATFAIPAVDGSLFLDVGAAWDKSDQLEFWPLYTPGSGPEPPGEKRMRASVGFGLLVYFIMPMNFEFAKQTDLQGEYSDYQFHFSFGKSF